MSEQRIAELQNEIKSLEDSISSTLARRNKVHTGEISQNEANGLMQSANNMRNRVNGLKIQLEDLQLPPPIKGKSGFYSHPHFSTRLPIYGGGSITRGGNNPTDNARYQAAIAISQRFPNINKSLISLHFNRDGNNPSIALMQQWQNEYNEANGVNVIVKEPVTYQEWINYAMSQNVDNPNNLQAIIQIQENVGRNDISVELAIQKLKSIAGGFQSSRDDEETTNTKKNLQTFESLQENLSILVNQANELIQKAFLQIKMIPQIDPTKINVKDGRTELEIAKETLDNLINESIPRAFNNIENMKNNFLDNGFAVPPNQIKLIEHLQTDLSDVRLIAASVIDESPALKILAGIRLDQIKLVVI